MLYWALVIIIAVIVGGYLGSGYLHPFRACRSCHGIGVRRGAIYRKATRDCTHCGGKGRFRKDKIAEQVFYQGPSTNNNKYDFPTLASIDTFRAEQLQKPPGADFWEWIKTAKLPV